MSETDYTPYYYTSEYGKYEIDFLVQNGRDIVSVEVKAETNLQAKSLKAYNTKFAPAYAVRVSMSDYRVYDWLTNIPLYAICSL